MAGPMKFFQRHRGALASHSLIRPDDDGVVRRLTMALDGQRHWPHLAAALVGKRATAPLPEFRKPDGAAALTLQGERLVGFRGASGNLRSFPMSALLAGEVPRELIQRRVALVGLTATGLGAQFSTAKAGLGGAMPAVAINASFVADLMQGRVVALSDRQSALTMALLALWIVMATV